MRALLAASCLRSACTRHRDNDNSYLYYSCVESQAERFCGGRCSKRKLWAYGIQKMPENAEATPDNGVHIESHNDTRHT